MVNELSRHEPIPLPDLRRAEKIPSLPGWLISRENALGPNLQIGSSGTFQDMMTLPAELMFSGPERAAIGDHLASLNSLLDLTPERDQKSEAMTLAAVTKLIQALPGQRSSEGQVEAKGEAYMAALDDVPYWAVEAGIRKWYRGQCGNDENGKPYDFNWAPAPAALRRVSRSEASWVHARILNLNKLLNAVEFVDCASELARGRAAMAGLWHTIGKGGDVKSLTFEEAIKIGGKLPSAPTAKAAE